MDLRAIRPSVCGMCLHFVGYESVQGNQIVITIFHSNEACDNDDDNDGNHGGSDGVRDGDHVSDSDRMMICRSHIDPSHSRLRTISNYGVPVPFHVVPPRGGRNNGLERFEFRFASQPPLVISYQIKAM